MNRFFSTICVIYLLILLTGCHKDAEDITVNGVTQEFDDNLIQIINQVQAVDVENDGLSDDVFLFYYDNYIVLQVKDGYEKLVIVDNEDQLFGDNLGDHYNCNLYVKSNKVLVCITYEGTNKYGSTSWIYCYEHQDGNLNRIWDSEELLKRNVFIDDYDDKDNIIKVVVGDAKKEMVVDEEDEEMFLAFINSLLDNGNESPEFSFSITPSYIMYDYNNDNVDELVTRTVVPFGACPITGHYITIYEFSDKGIIELDSFFSSSNPKLTQDIFSFY